MLTPYASFRMDLSGCSARLFDKSLSWSPTSSVSMDIAVLAAAVVAWLQHLTDERRFSRQQRLDARAALSSAFHETEGYYKALSGGAAKSPEREYRIADLWERAAILSEAFNPLLATRLGLKSRYWREGAAWSDEQVAAARIQLATVRRDANFTLIQR